jgi:SAM-dependent methyltransferase
MVSYDVRHDLGEYYTPDWLAEYMLRQKMDIDADDMVLDPGCGSGTFLVEALQLKIDESDDDPEELISRIPEEVVGFDIHPLAVMIAKANYVAAIRDLLQYRRERIQLPVYLADSVLFDEELRDTQTLDGAEVRGPIRIAGGEYYLPQKAIENPQDFDEALDIMADFIDDGEGSSGVSHRTSPNLRMLRRPLSGYGNPSNRQPKKTATPSMRSSSRTSSGPCTWPVTSTSTRSSGTRRIFRIGTWENDNRTRRSNS